MCITWLDSISYLMIDVEENLAGTCVVSLVMYGYVLNREMVKGVFSFL